MTLAPRKMAKPQNQGHGRRVLLTSHQDTPLPARQGNHGCEVSKAEELHRVSALPDEGIVSLFTALKALVYKDCRMSK